ncbi:unnamed protein product [Ambrosiozyma monospora]|uniref:Unnamed protein product n=1 Tax=Ambrosiozyma monospora TaxID=43982 RepID=A0A9W6Z621_AMBMO|nr:unnamed protein product [Ambrosiozyma monospora]
MAPIPVLLASFLASTSIISSETESYDDEYITPAETDSFYDEPIFTTCVGEPDFPVSSPVPTTIVDTIVTTTTASVSISTFVATATTTTDADDTVETSVDESKGGIFMNGILRFLFGQKYDLEYHGRWTAGMNQLTGTFDEDDLMIQTTSEHISITSDATVTSKSTSTPSVVETMPSVTATYSSFATDSNSNPESVSNESQENNPIKRDQLNDFQNLDAPTELVPTPSFSETSTSTKPSTETVKEQMPTTSSVVKSPNVSTEHEKTRFGTRNSRLIASVCIALLLCCIGFMIIIYIFYRKMHPNPGYA